MKSGMLTRFGVDAIQKAVVRACRQDEAIPNVSFGFFGDMECDLVIVSDQSRLHPEMLEVVRKNDRDAPYRRRIFTEELCRLYRLGTIRLWHGWNADDKGGKE